MLVTSAGREKHRPLAAVLVILAVGTACSDTPSSIGTRPSEVSVQVVQLRRDVVVPRVQLAIHNRTDRPVTIDSARLSVTGIETQGWLKIAYSIPAHQTVDFPVRYGDIHCPAQGRPRVGRPQVSLRVGDRQGDSRPLHLAATVPYDLLAGIARRTCAVNRVLREVELRFEDGWRLHRSPQGDELHGILQARLRSGSERRIMQLIGANMYGLKPALPPADAATPLAVLTTEQPLARIPVIAWAARCDGHTIGEIKRPYEFLVWVAGPTDEGLAVTPEIDAAGKLALRRVCAF